MIIGVLASIGTGVLQPLNTWLFGILTQSIVDYAMALGSGLPPEQMQNATDVFINDIKDFAINNTYIGVGMLVFSYVSTEVFNYAALKQVQIGTFQIQKPGNCKLVLR